MAVVIRLEANRADVKAAAEEFIEGEKLPVLGIVLRLRAEQAALDAGARGDVVLVVTSLGLPFPVRAEDKVQVRGVNALCGAHVTGLLVAIDGETSAA